MDLLTREDLGTLLGDQRPPCVSLYVPTQPGGGEADRIHWRKAITRAEEALEQRGLRGVEAKALLRPARELLEDPTFWREQGHGLAFFLAEGFLRLYRLPVTFEELVVVGRRFHVTPLLPLLGGDGRFFVLALSQNGVRLLQGTRQAISAVDLTGVPRNLAEALATHDVDEPLTFHTRPAGGLGSWTAIYHGHGVGIDDHKDDLLRYFQRIDRGLHPLLRQEHAPLVLAGVGYLLPLYRQAGTYPHLLEQGVEGNPDHLSDHELHRRAWALVEPLFQRSRQQALERYEQLAGTARAACDLEQVVPATCRGELEVLFVAPSRRAWGRFDPDTKEVRCHEQPEPGDEDLVNVAAIHTLRHGGTVYALGPDEVPDGGPVAGLAWLSPPRHGKRP
jgi:hypothetical protein